MHTHIHTHTLTSLYALHVHVTEFLVTVARVLFFDMVDKRVRVTRNFFLYAPHDQRTEVFPIVALRHVISGNKTV